MMLMRVDLENRCQSLQEELAFSKSVFEEEVRKPDGGMRLVEVDSSQQQEYDFKMAQALEDLRSQHDEQVRLYHLELDNAKLSCDQNDKAASVAREELQGGPHARGVPQLPTLQKQASAAEDHICELEEALAGKRDKLCKMLDTKEEEMTEVRDAMQQQLAGVPGVAAYQAGPGHRDKRLLQSYWRGEEERLKLFPSPSSRVTISQATSSSSSSSSSSGSSMSAGQGRGKRWRLETEDTPGSYSNVYSMSSGSGLTQQAMALDVVNINEASRELFRREPVFGELEDQETGSGE